MSHVLSSGEIALKTELDPTTLGTPSSSPTSMELTPADTEVPPAPPVVVPGGVDIGEIDPPAQVDDNGGISVQANIGVNDER